MELQVSDETAAEMLERMGTDGQLWAKEFIKTFRGEVVSGNGHRASVDEGAIISWFANAIEAGKSAITNIEDFQFQILAINMAKGWYDEDRTVLESFALLTEEVGEGITAWRKWGMSDATSKEGQHNIGCELADHRAYGMPGEEPPCSCGTIPKPEGVGSECADIFIRLMDFVQRHNVNLRAEVVRKLEFNNTRPYRHGDLKA